MQKTRIRTAGKHQNAGRSLAMRRAWYADDNSENAGTDNADSAGGDSETFDAEYVKKLREENAKRRIAERELRAKLDELTAADQKAKEAKLLEEQQYKPLLEQRDSELAKLRAELETERIGNLRAKVAIETGLPPALAARLQGKTEEEIRADAEELKKVLPQPQTPDASKVTTAGSGQRTTTVTPGGQPAKETDAQKRERLFGARNRIFVPKS